MEGKEIPSTSQGIMNDNDKYQRKCLPSEKINVGMRIKTAEYRLLARLLGLDESEIDEIDMESNDSNLGLPETVLQILNRWEEIRGTEATTEELIKALQAIHRQDLILELFSDCRFSEKFPLSKLQKEIQFRQRKEFTHLKLPLSLWLKKKLLPMEEFFVELTMKRKNETGNEEDEKIDKEDIFLNMEEKTSNRVLIEGHPGYGKTTLILKFLSDWSTGEKYMSDKFDLIFVIALRNYKDNLETHLLQQCEGIEGSDQEKLKAIESIGRRVLILLDGLDEASQNVKENLFPLLKGTKFPSMTVVVTCRTGFIHFGKESSEGFESVAVDGFEHHFIWDKRIQIKGISKERQEEFLRKYFNDEFIEVEILHELGVNDFCKCPLFLLLLTVLVKESDIRSIKTKTDLYKEIFNFVINRSLDREKLMGREFDVFNLKNADQYGYRSLLINFSHLCLEKIKHQSLLFEESELLKCSGGNDVILKLGILSKQISFFNYEEKEHYEPVHRTFIEFLAAFYISSLKESQIKNEIKKLTLKFNIWPTSHQLLYPFLGGCLKSKAFILFNALSCSQSLISVFELRNTGHYSLNGVLKEIPKTLNIIKSLFPFRPRAWDLVEYQESLLCWYIDLLTEVQRNGFEEEISLLIPYHINIVNHLPINIKLNKILIDLEYKKEFNVRLRDNIKCQHLYIDFFYGNSDCLLSLLKYFFLKIKAEKIWLNIKLRLISQIKEENLFIESKGLISCCIEMLHTALQKIHFLIMQHIPPSLFLLISPHIQELIKNRKIEHGLSLSLDGEMNDCFKTELKSFLTVVAKSHLKSFGFCSGSNMTTNTNFPLFIKDFPIFNKKWESIYLNGFDVEDDLQFISVENVYSCQEDLPQVDVIPKLLLKCQNVKKLSCPSSLLFNLNLCKSFSLWDGFETVEILDLTMSHPSEDYNLCLPVISCFKNICEIHCEEFRDVSYFLEVIQRIPTLKKISLSSFCRENFEWMLLKRLQDFNNDPLKKELCLDELEMELRGGSLICDDILEFIRYMKRCFMKNIFLKLSFVFDHIMQIKNFLRILSMKKEFRIFSSAKELLMTPYVDLYISPTTQCKISITYKEVKKSPKLKTRKHYFFKCKKNKNLNF